MRTLTRLALRNLVRNRRRTALTLVIVALGTWAIIAMWGLDDGMMDSMIRAQVLLDTGDVQVHRAGYLDDPDLARTFSKAELQDLLNALESQAAVREATPRLEAEGLLQSAYGSQGVSVRGIDPQAEARVTELAQRVSAGRFLGGAGEVLLGRSLADKLDVRLGERVVLQVQGLKRPASRGFRLVGVLHTGLALLDQAQAFIALADARALTGVSGADGVVLRLGPRARAERVVAQLQRQLGPDLEVSSYFDLNPLMRDIIRIEHFEMLPTMLLLALLVGFGVANTITFTVLERMRQFGVMLSLGLRPRQLKHLITLESLFVSGLGFALGAAAGLGLNLALERVGIDLSFYTDAFPDLGVPQVVYAKADWMHAVYGLVVVVLTTLVAARAPARRAAKLEPTEAMRYV